MDSPEASALRAKPAPLRRHDQAQLPACYTKWSFCTAAHKTPDSSERTGKRNHTCVRRVERRYVFPKQKPHRGAPKFLKRPAWEKILRHPAWAPHILTTKTR